MDSLRKILSIIYYIIWIPLGLLLFTVIIFLIVANPLKSIGQLLGGPSSQGGPPGGGFPSQEMMKQFMQQQGPAPDGAGQESPRERR